MSDSMSFTNELDSSIPDTFFSDLFSFENSGTYKDIEPTVYSPTTVPEAFEVLTNDSDPVKCGVPSPAKVPENSEIPLANAFDDFLKTIEDTETSNQFSDFMASASQLDPAFEKFDFDHTVSKPSFTFDADPSVLGFDQFTTQHYNNSNNLPYATHSGQRAFAPSFHAPPAPMTQMHPVEMPQSFGYMSNNSNYNMQHLSLQQAVEIPVNNSWEPRLRARPSPIASTFMDMRKRRRSRTDTPKTPLTAPLAKRNKRNGAAVHTKREYDAELPKKKAEKDWVRVNNTTQGKSTRTGKINNYNAKHDGGYAATTRHPLASQAFPYGQWATPDGRFEFKYHRTGELSRKTYTTEELHRFIYSHPTSAQARLTLWIQKAPADSASRYNMRDSSRCRFACCPARGNNNWTITIGHMRVALDEQWATYGASRDPFSVAAFVHLYCLERFLDLPDICRRFDVRADDRSMPREPRGCFTGGLTTKADGACSEVVKDFVQRCRDGSLEKAFPGYPVHAGFRNGEAKPHAATLCHALTQEKIKAMCRSKVDMMEKRGLAPSSILVHLGDVEMALSEGGKGRKAAGTAMRIAVVVPLIGPVPADRKKRLRAVEEKEEGEEDEEDNDVEYANTKHPRLENGYTALLPVPEARMLAIPEPDAQVPFDPMLQLEGLLAPTTL